MTLAFAEPKLIDRVELYTTSGYEMANYVLSYLDDSGSWVELIAVTDNTSVHRSHQFLSVATMVVRIDAQVGPPHQPGYVRINEIEIY